MSTDDPAIAAVASAAGAEVPGLRPAELAQHYTPKIPVLIHLIEGFEARGGEASVIVDLDPTSPLRLVSDIEACIDLLDSRTETDLVITGYEAEKNPYFNMVELDDDGFARLVKESRRPPGRRQDAPTVYSMNASIYVWRRKALGEGLWSRRVRLYEMPRERSVDIDSPLDWDIVEMLMQRGRSS